VLTWLIAAVALILLLRFRVNSVWLIGAALIVGLIIR